MTFNKFSNISESERFIQDEYIDIDKESILMEFALDDEIYCILDDSNNEDIIYFAKIDFDEEGNEIIKSIEDEKYEKVVNYYEKIINEMEDSNEQY
jgi:hypothetical protein